MQCYTVKFHNIGDQTNKLHTQLQDFFPLPSRQLHRRSHPPLSSPAYTNTQRAPMHTYRQTRKYTSYPSYVISLNVHTKKNRLFFTFSPLKNTRKKKLMTNWNTKVSLYQHEYSWDRRNRLTRHQFARGLDMGHGVNCHWLISIKAPKCRSPTSLNWSVTILRLGFAESCYNLLMDLN